MKILLCGLPRVGKTTCGTIVARVLGWDAVDLDVRVEELFAQETGHVASCREIYLSVGEAAFRQWEGRALASIETIGPCIVALGGGCLESEENCRLVQELGFVVYLKGSIQTVWSRIRESVPAYLDPDDLGGSLQQLVRQREPRYMEISDSVVDVNGLGIPAMAEAVIASIETKSEVSQV